jgi:nifR3 family TIM-barrel protein
MAVQLFGDEPEAMAEAAVIAAGYHPDWIDINMGCPAPKIAGSGSGAALLKNLSLAREVIRAVVRATPLPVTVKLRKGWDGDEITAVEAAGIAEQEGAAAVTIHGRTRAQMYAPPVDLRCIAAVKRAVSIPVIANGDICDADSAVQMLEQTGCDLLMIGRGALGNPWVFRQLKAYFEQGVRLPEPGIEERLALLLEQIRRACGYKGEYAAMREARSHAAWYFKGMQGAAALRREAGQLRVYGDLRALCERARGMSPEA